MKQANIRVIIVRPGEPPEETVVSNKLKTFQGIVGGYIETMHLEDGVILVCNEEGKLKPLPPNTYVPECSDVIAGTFFLTHYGGEGYFISLTDEQVTRNLARFG